MEIKFQDVPKLTRSMHITMEDLKIKELLVVYPGKREFPLAEGIRAVPLASVGAGIFELGKADHAFNANRKSP